MKGSDPWEAGKKWDELWDCARSLPWESSQPRWRLADFCFMLVFGCFVFLRQGLAMKIRLALNSQSSRLWLQSAGITDLCQHAWHQLTSWEESKWSRWLEYVEQYYRGENCTERAPWTCTAAALSLQLSTFRAHITRKERTHSWERTIPKSRWNDPLSSTRVGCNFYAY
jgi:hypothetical protein